LEDTRMDLSSDMEGTLKKKADELKEKVQKVDRLVLSGEKSKTVRQDLFTKKVGIWTNPLEKIVVNFYQDYLKLLVTPDKGELPFLKFDAPLGGFILATENPQFSILGDGNFKPMKISGNDNGKRLSLPSLSVQKRDMFMFVTSFLLSFALIYFGPKVLNSISNQGDTSKPIVLAPTEAPKENPPAGGEPSKAPTPAFKKEDVRIKILNGSGTVGKASEVKDILKKAGYVDILTANADKFDYKITEVQVKDDKKAIFDVLKKDLSENVKITKSTVLDADEASDVIIIVGTDFE
ncbi:MAG: LytR C-terminal domain-containing protein, partial [Microgenomates group bacterium]